jgi:integrase
VSNAPQEWARNPRVFAAMATITKLIAKETRAVSFVAQVRIRPFKACQKTFKVVTNSKAARQAAIAWGKEEEKRLRTELEKGQSAVREDMSRLTVGKLINTYLEDPEVKGLKTFKDIDRLLSWWLKQHVSTRILDFNVLVIRAARDKLNDEKDTPATANRYISAMRACWNFGLNTGFIPQDRAWPRKLLLTEPPGRTKFLTDEQLAALLKAAEGSPMMRSAILLSVGCGVRQGELLRLTWQDIDLDGGKLTLMKPKGRRGVTPPRTVHAPATVIAALRALKSGGGNVVSIKAATGPVFMVDGRKPKKNQPIQKRPLKVSTLQKRWNAIFKAAGLVGWHWHDLRHSCASFLARRGASLLEIGSVLGHKSPSMTYRYSHLVQGKPVTGHTELDALLSGK